MQIRKIQFTPHVNPYAFGSCLVEYGNTKVMVTVSCKDEVPPFLKDKKIGWLTAEYCMLPMATHSRGKREREGASGRTKEIERFIGRSLRNCVDRTLLGERTLTIDCDVLLADGGTRVASISGAYVALYFAVEKLKKDKLIAVDSKVLKMMISAISVGIDSQGNYLVDLDYAQDSKANVDMNVVMNEKGEFLEFLATTEGQKPMTLDQIQGLLKHAKLGIEKIIELQKEVIGT